MFLYKLPLTLETKSPLFNSCLRFPWLAYTFLLPCQFVIAVAISYPSIKQKSQKSGIKINKQHWGLIYESTCRSYMLKI